MFARETVFVLCVIFWRFLGAKRRVARNNELFFLRAFCQNGCRRWHGVCTSCGSQSINHPGRSALAIFLGIDKSGVRDSMTWSLHRENIIRHRSHVLATGWLDHPF